MHALIFTLIRIVSLMVAEVLKNPLLTKVAMPVSTKVVVTLKVLIIISAKVENFVLKYKDLTCERTY